MSFETFALIWPFIAIGFSIAIVFVGIRFEQRAERRKAR
jgi:hypothetical protein